MKQMILTAIMVCSAIIATACGGKTAEQSSPSESQPVEVATQRAGVGVEVDADTVYSLVEAQTAMGPRVPGTKGHERCVTFIKERLAAAGAVVSVQDTVFAPAETDIKPQRVRNITGRFNEGAERHVLLLAHYDTRPWADEDTDPANHDIPIDGANDGASGVAVLLEIARLMEQLPDNVEIEMLFVDAEDAGNHTEDLSWCIGSQAWAAAFDPLKRRTPDYAILLDMVGGKDALFHREYFSEQYARGVNNQVWNTARQLGYGDRFPNAIGGAINDDHIHILSVGIPAIDIVESAHPATQSFNPTWHTLNDNINNIDRATLKMVGDVVINTIFR